MVMIGVYLATLALIMSQLCSGLDVSAEYSWISGPGLNPKDVILPSTYIHVQLKNSRNEILSVTPDPPPFQVTIEGQMKYLSKPIQPKITIEKIADTGQYYIRYKTHGTWSSFKLSVTMGGEHLAGSPVSLDGPIHAAWCRCPGQKMEDWMDTFGCDKGFNEVEKNILKDLEPFQNVDMEEHLRNAKTHLWRPNSASFCHYVIKNQDISRNCYGQHVGFNMFSDRILLYLKRRSLLPDTEFLFNLGDWPLVKKKAAHPIIAMLSWGKDDQAHDIVVPTYEMMDNAMDKRTPDTVTAQQNDFVPWESKAEKAFFRGRDSRRERLDIVRISKNNSDLVDAGLTNYFFFRDLEEELGKAERIRFYTFFHFKYQLNIDGTVAAYRFPNLLAGGSAVLKQNSPYIEHFYHALEPNKHFLPVKRDLSDLLEKVKWAKSHDPEMREMAFNAREFVQENLLPQHLICYHAKVLLVWSRRVHQPSQEDTRGDMELVEEGENKEWNCDCGDINKDEL